MKEHIDEMTKVLVDYTKKNHIMASHVILEDYAEQLYNAGYRKQNDEELIDKIATYFEEVDNWTKLKYSWNVCSKSVQLRDMLRDAITERK